MCSGRPRRVFRIVDSIADRGVVASWYQSNAKLSLASFCTASSLPLQPKGTFLILPHSPYGTAASVEYRNGQGQNITGRNAQSSRCFVIVKETEQGVPISNLSFKVLDGPHKLSEESKVV